MPHLTDVLMLTKPLRKFKNYRYVPVYREILPAQLKDTVASKGENKKARPCLQEMSLMLVCLKQNEFNQTMCAKELEEFASCQKQFMDAKTRRQEAEAKGIMTSKGGRVSSKQLNTLLRKYPQPK